MSPEPTQSTQVSGLSFLIEWANAQDHWVRMLVSKLTETRRLISTEVIDSLYRVLLRESGLSEGDPVNVAPLSTPAISTATEATIRLVSLKHIDNINALAPNQEIEFHERLTICFGENASGKTGYVRILKRAAAVRNSEPVLPNIHAWGTGGSPQARIVVSVGGEERVIEWQGEQGVDPLTRVDVFDARAAVVHLTEDLAFSYTPADLSLFPLVADGIGRVQAKLQVAKDERRSDVNPFVDHFQSESNLCEKIKRLGPLTDLRELGVLAEVSEIEEATLPGLRKRIDAIRSGSVRAHIEQVEFHRTILSGALVIADAVVAFNCEAYGGAVTACRAARANHERATNKALADETVPGVLGDAWRKFVEAAESYIRDTGLKAYPESGDPCLYCQQPLGDAAVALLRKYRDYCNDSLRQAVEAAEERVRNLCEPVESLRLDELTRDIGILVQALEDPRNPPPDVAAAQTALGYASALQKALRAEGDCPAMVEGLRNTPKALQRAIEVAQASLVSLRRPRKDRERALAEDQSRMWELKARLALRKFLPAICKHVQAARWAKRAHTYLVRFPGIKRSLTEASKRASDEVMNRDFRQQFELESRALRVPPVTLDFPGREGLGRRRKLLSPEHGLDEILSEGEQKVVALADFLAEASLKPDRSPIVMDDPVTSLDHKRLQHVVDRVVELSRDRQVIVFTHDIWFAAELLARFERAPHDCAFYNVTSEGRRIGLIERGSHPRTDTFRDRKRRITTLITRADAETGVARRESTEKGYEELRGMCEIVVEQDLLKGVTQRYRPNVRMTVLDQIRTDLLPAAFQVIVPIFQKCCRIIASHSQPLTTLGVRPDLDELRLDLNALQDARREYLRD